MTSANAAIGTWAYMAPERFSTSEIHPSSDIYALACVLYQCLTGEQPFPGSTLEQVAVGHMVTPPPRPSERAGIPRAMDQVIATGLAKKPEERYPTTVEMATAAKEAVTVPTGQHDSTHPTQAAPVSPGNQGPPIWTYPQTPPGPYGLPPSAPTQFSAPHLQRPAGATRVRSGRGGTMVC